MVEEMAGIVDSFHWRIVRRASLTLLPVILIFTLSACSVLQLIEDQSPDSVGTDNESGTLTCSSECSDRGQCGKTERGGEMVLLNASAPALSNHDTALQADTVVKITRIETVSVYQVSNGEALDLSFYNVEAVDRGNAWVASWCIES